MNEQAKRSDQERGELAGAAHKGSGASLVEYALLLASLCLVVLVAFRGFSANASKVFSGIASDLEEAG